MEMSSLFRGCCAMALLALAACGSRLTAPNHPTAEARNGVTEKKPRKQRQPVVAPPPAYGNKIVHGGEDAEDIAGAAPPRRWM
jgi:hypothetical protein